MPPKIRKRKEGTYELWVSCGTEQGKQKNARKTVHCTEKEVERQYALFVADVMKGKVLVAGTERMKLKAFYDYWKRHYAETNTEKTTMAYNDALFTRIEEALGHLRIDKIQPRQILEFIDQLRAPDAGQGDKPLSANTIRKHFVLLNTLFNHAKKWEFVLTNPCEKVDAPKQEKAKKQILNEVEMAQFLAALADHNILKHKLWVFLSFTGGLRREEIFALKWKDIDFAQKVITIERAAVYVAGTGVIIKDTKSDSGERRINPPAEVFEMLDTYRKERQAAIKRRNKRRKVIALNDPSAADPCTPESWVFSQFNGSVGHPHSFNTFIGKFCEDNNLPEIGPHTFRHMYGSYLLRSGVDLAAVSAMLGHANKSFTANTYIHALQSAKDQSAVVMQGILNNLQTGIKKEG